MLLAGVLLILLSVGTFLLRKGKDRGWAILVVYTLAFFVVVALGYHGGELVFGGGELGPR
jgi:predicted PurR-regulated permease PerM